MNLQVIDGNSIGYSCHYGTVLKAGEQQTQAIFGFVRTLMELRERYKECKPIVLWDGRATWRFELCPTYKSNRHSEDPKKEAIREAYKTQVPFIQEILKSLGVCQMRSSIHEADDLASLIVKSKKADDKITLITGDKDWLQLVRHNVNWYDIRTKTLVTSLNFKNYTGYTTPESFLDGKCLHGDSSDAVSGVGGIGEKGALQFLATYGSVENFFNGVDAGVIKPTRKAHLHLASEEGREIYNRNKKVMSLFDVPPIDSTKLISNNALTKDRQKFIELCGQLAFTSFLKNPDEILGYF